MSRLVSGWRVSSRGLVCVALISALCLLACEKSEPLPSYSKVPAFALTSQRGTAFSLDDVRGNVWIANFIFTSCPDICPLLTKKMGDLRLGLVRKGVPVRFVSFSVDPDTDTPKVLQAYAKEHNALFDDWAFVTGPLADVRRVIADGFHERVEPDPKKPANVFHGSHFVLIDQHGVIRGYYRSEHQGLLALSRDAARLAEEK